LREWEAAPHVALPSVNNLVQNLADDIRPIHRVVIEGSRITPTRLEGDLAAPLSFGSNMTSDPETPLPRPAPPAVDKETPRSMKDSPGVVVVRDEEDANSGGGREADDPAEEPLATVSNIVSKSSKVKEAIVKSRGTEKNHRNPPTVQNRRKVEGEEVPCRDRTPHARFKRCDDM